MGSIKNAFKFIFSPTASRTTGILVILIIAAAVPLTVFIAQKQQEIRQRAEDTTIIDCERQKNECLRVCRDPSEGITEEQDTCSYSCYITFNNCLSLPTPTPTLIPTSTLPSAPTSTPTPILWQISGKVYVDVDNDGKFGLPPDTLSSNANVSIQDADNTSISGLYSTDNKGSYQTIRMWHNGDYVSVKLNTIPAGCSVNGIPNPHNFPIEEDTVVTFPITCTPTPTPTTVPAASAGQTAPLPTATTVPAAPPAQAPGSKKLCIYKSNVEDLKNKFKTGGASLQEINSLTRSYNLADNTCRGQ